MAEPLTAATGLERNATDPPDPDDLPDAVVDAVLERVWSRCERDYRGYQRVFVKRRLQWVMSQAGLSGLDELRDRLNSDPRLLDLVVNQLSIGVTEMFRDPVVFAALRSEVIPVLAASEFVRVWVAGCSTGEEAFSVAILLEEAGLGNRSFIYATDIHQRSILAARAGVYDAASMKANTRNYLMSGGQREFSEHFSTSHGKAIMAARLRDRILFSRHNLAHDTSFNAFDLVLCRNVLIYFGRELRAKAHETLHDSLRPLGFLVLGRRESLRFSPHHNDYETVDRDFRIFRRVR